ncbi:SWIM zinc finger family protein [Leucothrix mucor]|uniref:SWIM zinc finger family protein n=1 Tax=Leucothrix mucor TaxID=45248 RepID=UPI0004057D62|nr:hypothetical protein [Leucothrix mucor]
MDLKTKELLTLFTIDPQELLNTYGQATLVRGLDYFNKERVQDIEQALPTADDGVVIVGRVSNGRGKTYVVRLELYPGKRGFGLAARSDCNCPVGDECKHGVALLFTFLSQLKALDSDPEQEQISAESQQVVRWLAGIEGAEDTLNVSAMTDERYQPEFHMIHLMSIRSFHGKPVLWIESVKSRVLKKGGLRQASPIAISSP